MMPARGTYAMVEILEQGDFPEGRVRWLLISKTISPDYARSIAERFGTITESDETDDGRWSFSVTEVTK